MPRPKPILAGSLPHSTDHGLELELDLLHLEIDQARAIVERGLDRRKVPVNRAVLAGLEHTQVERMQGKAKAPKTFII